jgi:hypothetical protein
VSAPVATAELIEDRGEAAISDHFFRSPEFLEAEGVTHTLRIRLGGEGEEEAGELLAPLIVREIGEGPERDAISPYGYPGLIRSGRSSSRNARSTTTATDGVDPAAVDFSSVGLVSAFIRHTLDERPPLAAASERSVVQISDPALPAKSRPSDRNQINKNLRNGYAVRLVPGPDTSPEERAGFLDVYEQTMRRAGAAGHYFFGAAYFNRILEAGGTWLALGLAPDGEVAAASIAARSDGFLHYYLSGSADSNLRDSPMKNVVALLVELSAETGLPLNLGGGLARGDRLEEFKRGFANREQAWRTSELVCDPDAYERLSAGRDAAGFFPAYRAPR